MYKPGLFWERVKYLPNNKIEDLSELKPIADDNLILSQKTDFRLFQTEGACR